MKGWYRTEGMFYNLLLQILVDISDISLVMDAMLQWKKLASFRKLQNVFFFHKLQIILPAVENHQELRMFAF